MLKYITYACDIGSTIQDNFGWVRIAHDGSTTIPTKHNHECIEELRDSLIADILDGERIAFGIEAPLFIPIPLLAENLSRRRVGEGNRSWSAPIGLAVTTLALHQMCWLFKNIIRGIRKHQKTINFCFVVDEWRAAENDFLIWEAFVSGKGHANAAAIGEHIADAYTAAESFRLFEQGHEPDRKDIVMLDHDDVSLSLIEVALLHSGATHNLEQIRNVDIIVIKANEPIPMPL